MRFGEVVIGDWFKSHLDRLSYKGRPLSQWLDRQMKADLCHFEGNAQALRLLTKVYRVDSAFGMDLMPAVLNTLVKYPVDSTRVDKASSTSWATTRPRRRFSARWPPPPVPGRWRASAAIP